MRTVFTLFLVLSSFYVAGQETIRIQMDSIYTASRTEAILYNPFPDWLFDKPGENALSIYIDFEYNTIRINSKDGLNMSTYSIISKLKEWRYGIDIQGDEFNSYTRYEVKVTMTTKSIMLKLQYILELV